MDRLRELRDDNDLYQKEIAKVLNIPKKNYSNYETKFCDISVKYLRKLSNFYNVSIDYILYRTDNRSAYSISNVKVTRNMNRLKDLRKSIGKTQESVALDLTMPLKTYIKYEHGERSLNTLLLNIFADYYKTSIDYIVYNTDDVKPHKRSIVDWKEK